MTFEEFWKEVCKTKLLREGENQLIPSSLSKKTKDRIMKLSPEEAADRLKECMAQIYKGSIESIDTLISKKIKDD